MISAKQKNGVELFALRVINRSYDQSCMLLPLLQKGKVLFYFGNCCRHRFLLKIVQHLLYILFFLLLLGKHSNRPIIYSAKIFYDLAHEAERLETSYYCQMPLE